jgi:CRISPR-associated protein Cas5
MTLDLNFLLEPPDFSTRAMLTIDALAPLSMVTSMPGKYYRSQPEPTDAMLYGLLENALGWHIEKKVRNELKKRLEKQFNKTAIESGVRFVSLLQFHLHFAVSVTPITRIRYDDLWSQHMKGSDERHTGGSRERDYRANEILVEVRDGKHELNMGEMIKFHPHYYISPTAREYIVPQGEYKYRVETSSVIANLFLDAISNPAAPLYLGSNDGWVDAMWEVLK